jgi:uncharacterized membrane protein YcgQ (UPF0703/DUF1980 family)
LNYSFINTKQIEFEGYIFLGEWHIENKLARFLNMICFIDSSVEACCYTSGWLNDSDNKWFILLLLASDEIKGTFQQ